MPVLARHPNPRREVHEDPYARREQSAACRGWVDHYGREFRDVVACGKALARLQGARGKHVDFGFTVQQCAQTLKRASDPNVVHGIATVASCVRRGFGHGVLQRGRRFR